MARIFITGSSDGLGQMAAIKLIDLGHRVVLHARNKERAEYAASKVQGAENILIADLSDLEETKQLAKQVNDLGAFEVIIHNAGVYRSSTELIFSVNTLAPYILTSLIAKPERLIYLSSGLHSGGDTGLKNLESGRVSYSDSKFHDLLLAKAVARKWPDVRSNAVDPGWVHTKMGGAGAPGNLDEGTETQVWLAISEEAKNTGRYYFHKKESRYQKAADDEKLQDRFLEICEKITGIGFPE